MIYVWLGLVFIIGACVGSFLNVCIHRLPLEKSVIWPGSRCGACLQAIRWYDNIPLVSYFLLRGRCRMCGAGFSFQYFLVELTTACGFAMLFYLEVVANTQQFGIINFNRFAIQMGDIPWQAWVIFAHHAILFSFLLVATVCDLREMEIPLSVTVPGTLVGLASSALWPWPWPYTPPQAMRLLQFPDQWQEPMRLLSGLYPWPFWGPLPEFMMPGGNWQTGLATGLVGALVGSMVLRFIRWIFSSILGVEALGLGDADIMMMAGAFLGWQPIIIGFFIGVFYALLIGILVLVVTRDNVVPFGPGLSLGILNTWLAWPSIGPSVQILFFNPVILGILIVLCVVFLALATGMLKAIRWLRGRKKAVS